VSVDGMPKEKKKKLTAAAEIPSAANGGL